jgi:ribosome maturation factor RimP
MNKIEIENIVNSHLEGKLTFLVDVEVKKGNVINVYVDSDEGVSISECAELSRFIESCLDREKEDFELRVSSPGLDKPFKLLRQYNRYIGKEINVLTKDERKFEGELKSLSEEYLEILIKQGQKARASTKSERLSFSDVKEAWPVISFKSKSENYKNN